MMRWSGNIEALRGGVSADMQKNTRGAEKQ
jgi:hypothetical protein